MNVDPWRRKLPSVRKMGVAAALAVMVPTAALGGYVAHGASSGSSSTVETAPLITSTTLSRVEQAARRAVLARELRLLIAGQVMEGRNSFSVPTVGVTVDMGKATERRDAALFLFAAGCDTGDVLAITRQTNGFPPGRMICSTATNGLAEVSWRPVSGRLMTFTAAGEGY